MKYRLLVADDDSLYLADMIKLSLEELPDFEVDPAPTSDQCRKMIKEKTYDVILLDIRFSTRPDDEEGLKLIPEIKKLSPKAEIIIHSSLNCNEMIAKTKELGAHSFLIKDYYSLTKLAEKVRTSIQKKSNREEDLDAGEALGSCVGAIFKSNAMKNVFKEAAKARKCPGLNVLITGPSGAGKELVANAIGQGIKDHPFVVMNCANIPENLVQSELLVMKEALLRVRTQKNSENSTLPMAEPFFLTRLDVLTIKPKKIFFALFKLGNLCGLEGTKLSRLKSG